MEIIKSKGKRKDEPQQNGPRPSRLPEHQEGTIIRTA